MPRFSICIPSSDRDYTLGSAIQSVLAQTNGDFELIIQDNASSPETKLVVDQFKDPRIKYQRADTRLAMHDNWEMALDGTSGDYVIYIGDDDALMPNCLERVSEILSSCEVDLLAWMAHTYYWPDVPDEKRRNYLTVDVRTAAVWAHYVGRERPTMNAARPGRNLPPGVLAFRSRQILQNWLSHRGLRVYIPTYHNLVSRRIINRVRARTGGRYFFNPLPDFGTLIANLYVSDEVLYLCQALSMTGHCGRSAGGTHGSVEAWNRSINRLVAEAKLRPEDLIPDIFEPFLWAPPLLAGCYANVKRDLFPDDEDLEVNWENFINEAAAQVNSEPIEVRERCRQWVLDSARRIGMDPESIVFPTPPSWERRVGLHCDPQGRSVFIYIDGEVVGLRSITDAVRLARQLDQHALYVTSVPGFIESVVRNGAPWKEKVNRLKERALTALAHR